MTDIQPPVLMSWDEVPERTEAWFFVNRKINRVWKVNGQPVDIGHSRLKLSPAGFKFILAPIEKQEPMPWDVWTTSGDFDANHFASAENIEVNKYQSAALAAWILIDQLKLFPPDSETGKAILKAVGGVK